MDAGQVGAGTRQRPRSPSGGQHELVVADRRAIRAADLVAGAIDADGLDAGPEVHAQRVALLRAEQHRRVLFRPAEHRLRQGGPLVGRVRLAPQERDAPFMSRFAQRPGDPGAGLAGSNDDDIHGCSLPSFSARAAGR